MNSELMDIRKYHKGRWVLKEHIMPPIITIFILLFLAAFIVITRGLYNNQEHGSNIPVMSFSIAAFDNTGLNSSEQELLSKLYEVLVLPEQNPAGETITMNEVYFNTLREYISNSEAFLTTAKISQISDKINQLQDIIILEDKTDFTKMTIDGRKAATNLAKQIYELNNLYLDYSMDGSIERIADISGAILFSNDASIGQQSFQLEAVIITIGLIVVLLCICIIIAKKNQLFVKEVIYDGFEEERFA